MRPREINFTLLNDDSGHVGLPNYCEDLGRRDVGFPVPQLVGHDHTLPCIHQRTRAETPQDGVVSAVLANIYLHYALDLWCEKIVTPRCQGDAMIMRFADDFACCFQYRSDMLRFYEEFGERLGNSDLSCQRKRHER